MKSNDQRIITGIINGNDKVLNQFYRENIRYIQGYILRNYGNEQDVEDVFQDAMVVLYQKLRSGVLEINVPITTYFYGICKNTWRNRLRKNKRLIIGEEFEVYEKTSYDISVGETEHKEKEHLYRKHFQNLSADHRKILHLFFEGKSMKEISLIIGCTEGYTRKKKFMAKKKLIKMIEGDPCYGELMAVC